MMKALYKKIGIFTTLCYCLGILMVAYFLISIPQDLKTLSLGFPIDILDQITPLFNKLNISIAVVLSLGMTSLILLLFTDKNNATNQQYYVAGKLKDTSLINDQEINENAENAENELILQKVDQIISEDKDLKSTSTMLLSTVCKEFEASQGAIYEARTEDGKRIIELISSFAYPVADSKRIMFEFGDGLVGQAAKEGKILNIDSVPEGYIKILSGLGSSTPTNLIIIPFISDGEVKGVAEIASFKKITKKEEENLNKIFSKLAPKFAQTTNEKPSKKKTSIIQ